MNQLEIEALLEKVWIGEENALIQFGRLFANPELTSDHIKFIESRTEIKWREEENTYGLVVLGFLHVTNKNYPEGVKCFKQAVELGNSTAMINLACLYQKGLGVEQNYSEAMGLYELAATLDDATAMNKLAYLYQKGLGVKQNYSEAIRLYQKAAELGNASAIYNLACLYQNGLGVEQNYSEAMGLYRQAAELGNASAISNLAYMYQKGLGVEQNYSEAIRLYQKAAELGNTSAMNNLAYLYQNGLGVEKDYSEAIRLYQKAAELGNASAMNNLAYMYRKGLGVEVDYSKAIELLYRCSTLGGQDAYNKLHSIALQGKDIEARRFASYKLFLIHFFGKIFPIDVHKARGYILTHRFHIFPKLNMDCLYDDLLKRLRDDTIFKGKSQLAEINRLIKFCLEEKVDTDPRFLHAQLKLAFLQLDLLGEEEAEDSILNNINSFYNQLPDNYLLDADDYFKLANLSFPAIQMEETEEGKQAARQQVWNLLYQGVLCGDTKNCQPMLMNLLIEHNKQQLQPEKVTFEQLVNRYVIDHPESLLDKISGLWILLEAFIISLLNSWLNELRKEEYITDVADNPEKFIGEDLEHVTYQSQTSKLDCHKSCNPQEAIKNNQLNSSPLRVC